MFVKQVSIARFGKALECLFPLTTLYVVRDHTVMIPVQLSLVEHEVHAPVV